MSAPILVIEDDAHIADLVQKNLELAGFPCQTFADAESAESQLAQLQPCLIILDLGLPGMDGIEFTRRLRRQNQVPILMLTARTSESDKVLGFEIGADDYLTKPFGTQELVARVRALLRRAAGARQRRGVARQYSGGNPAETPAGTSVNLHQRLRARTREWYRLSPLGNQE